MARGLLSRPVLRRLRAAVRRARAGVDRLRLPEADAPQEHWQRIALNADVGRFLDSLGPGRLAAAEISGSAHARRPWGSYAGLDYPQFDLCAPLTESRRFDVVICEQVLEHVLDPGAAVENLRRLCVPGGHVVVSTPFLIRVHELPAYGMPDLWRFTPRGLRVLLERAGLEVLAVRGWGNRDCIVANLDRWAAHRRRHSMRNEPDLPVQVWAFARNPG